MAETERQEILIDDFVVDATLEEMHNLKSEVTDLPTERGVVASDHIRLLPREVKVRCIVSDTPFGDLANRRALTAAVPSQDALDWLEAIRGERRLVTVATALRIYENMAMPDLEIVKDKETGEALRFTATFREFIFTENTTTVTLVAQPRNKKKTKGGVKSSTPVDDYTPITKNNLLGAATGAKFGGMKELLVSPLSNQTLGITGF